MFKILPIEKEPSFRELHTSAYPILFQKNG